MKLKLFIPAIFSILAIFDLQAGEVHIDPNKCGWLDGEWKCSKFIAKDVVIEPENIINPEIISATILKTHFSQNGVTISEQQFVSTSQSVDTLIDLEITYCGPQSELKDTEVVWGKAAEGIYTYRGVILGGVLASVKDTPFNFYYKSFYKNTDYAKQKCIPARRTVFLKCTVLDNEDGAGCNYRLTRQNIYIETFKSLGSTPTLILEKN